MSPAFRLGPYFVYLVRLPVLSISSPGQKFCPFESGSGFYQTSSGSNFIYFESRSVSGFIKAVQKVNPGPESISF